MTTPAYPFYCPHCGSFDRRNWSTGGCRYFDGGNPSGADPPCVFEDYDADMDARRRRVRFAWLGAALLLAFLTAVLVTTGAGAQDRGAWFKSLKVPGSDVSCCDISDCKRTEAQWRGEGWTAVSRHPGKGWVSIPHEKVLQQPKSLDGDAYLCEGMAGTIYCFVPPDVGS